MNHTYLRSLTLKRDQVAEPDSYPYSLPPIRGLDSLDLHPKVTYFIGENGSGKSTLLEAIAVAWGFNAEGGSKNFGFGTRPSHSELHEHLRLVKGTRRPTDGFFLRAESFFNVGTEIERPGGNIIGAYGGTSLHEQSHGESFLALLTHRLRGKGLYIFDEPEAALSPQRQVSALAPRPGRRGQPVHHRDALADLDRPIPTPSSMGWTRTECARSSTRRPSTFG